MTDYREILRLKSIGYSNRKIGESVRSSHHTIKAVLELAQKHNISYPLDNDTTNADLEKLFFPERKISLVERKEPDYAHIHKELAKSGVTLTLLWNEYCDECRANGEIPYMSTQFSDKYRNWARTTKATMRIQHKPGDAMQVDWAGNTIPYYDSVTGTEEKAYLFVAVLPCSCYTYVEACDDMKQENWLLCHIHAYEYFGGATRLLIPDNLKTGVISNNRYDVKLNKSYQELAEHYETAIVPARVRHPQDKSLAEGTVKLASTWIIAALRNQKFFTIAEVKNAVKEKLEELNDRPFQKLEGTRKTAYFNEEKDFMIPLPAIPYEPSVWTQATVGSDYLISDGKNKYSVPFDLIGEKVQIRLTKNIVEIFFNGGRVASHNRLSNPQRHPIVIQSHMPEEHRKYLNYNEDNFVEWGNSVGEKTSEVVRYFLTSGKASEQGYKPCISLMKLSERYGKSKLENACERMLAVSSTPTIRNISTFLKNGKTQNAVEPKERPPKSHGLTRGAAYFKRGGGHND